MSPKNFRIKKQILLCRVNIGKILETFRAIQSGATENEDYGNMLILNEYAGMKKIKGVPGRLQHGWEKLRIERSDYRNNNLRTFVWAQDAEEYAKSQGWKNFTSIGAPWLYLLDILDSQGWRKYELNSLRFIDELWVYGLHSVTADDPWAAGLIPFLEAANTSPARKKLVLLAYFDYIKLDELEKERFHNLDFVTLGGRRRNVSANSHLFRLYHLLIQTKLVVADYPTTLVFYALSVGCDIRWHHNESLIHAKKLAKVVNNFELVQAMEKVVLHHNEYLAFAHSNLGFESKKTPTDLRRIFGWEEVSSKRMIHAPRVLIEYFMVIGRFLKFQISKPQN